MKKIALSVPKPCHENWDAMSPQNRGKFCGSCQKTVIDFSNMSDGQLVAYFKKPPASVCGRFHTDQLQRPIEPPRKTLPWVKYFFHYTWPAFMLLLKSCGQKDAVNINSQPTKNIIKLPSDTNSFATMGMMVPYIEPVDTMKKTAPVVPNEHFIVGKPAMPESFVKGDTVIVNSTATDSSVVPPSVMIDTTKDALIDTIKDNDQSILMGRFLVGSVSKVCISPEIEKPVDEKEAAAPFFKAYPNPVRPGGRISIEILKNTFQVKTVQLFSMSGTLIKSENTDDRKLMQPLLVSIPSQLSAGIYLLQVRLVNGTAETVKLVVSN